MLIDKSLIDTGFTPIRTSDSVKSAKSRMNQEGVERFPVVDSAAQRLVGQINIHHLEKMDEDIKISNLDLDEAIKIYLGQHLFEAARVLLQYELSLIPVVDDKWTFLGIVSKRRVLDTTTKMLNLGEPGSVLTVELSDMDFTISEVVQIIEVEEAKILGLAVETPDETHHTFRISFKLNLQDISRVMAALRRYGYTVFSEAETEVFGEDLESRADELFKYIDM